MNRKPPPWGLIGAFLLSALVEAWLAGRDLDLTRPENMNWRWGRAAARRQATKADTLVLGTSMTQNGLLPRVIAAETGRPAQGLAVVASQTPLSYFYFRLAVAAGARPSSLLIDLPPYFIGSSLDGETAGWSDALGPLEALDLAWERGDFRFAADLSAERAIPSYYYRKQVRAWLLGALQGQAPSFRTENLAYLRNYKRNLGAIVAGKRPGYQGEISDYYKSVLLAEGWKPDPIKARYFRRLIGLAEGLGARVYWLLPPFAPALQAGRDAGNLDAAYELFAQGLLADHPNLTVIDARHSGYGASVFLDACHLDIDGASALSAEVAAVLARVAGNGPAERWVALPRFQPRSLNVPVETVADSMKAAAARR